MNTLRSMVDPSRKLLQVIGLLIGVWLSTPSFSQCTWYRDEDGDGFGTSGTFISSSCTAIPAGYVSNTLDCNDKSFNTAEWTTVGAVGSGIVVDPTKVVLGPDGTPYILYRHHTDPLLTKIVTVKKFTEGTW